MAQVSQRDEKSKEPGSTSDASARLFSCQVFFSTRYSSRALVREISADASVVSLVKKNPASIGNRR